jgi:glucan phosphoethanolaminetransferase (alkaline phosphatase superfamily)
MIEVRSILGFVIAPIVAALGMCVLVHTYLHFGSSPPDINFTYTFYSFLSSLPIAYILTLSVGIPLYLYLSFKNWLSISTCIRVGMVSGFILSLLVAFGQGLLDAIGISTIITITCVLTTLTFYVVSIHPRPTDNAEQSG